ncbi:MAG: hypothetical protein H7326_05680 [Bdellovibrionaceae bacterium]|nr:hypothetical protein [Pseudobdellovibrionaceae bacterium]
MPPARGYPAAVMRTHFWNLVFVNYRARHPELRGGQILQSVLKNLVASFAESTANFSAAPKSLTADKLNEDLIRNLTSSFAPQLKFIVFLFEIYILWQTLSL